MDKKTLWEILTQKQKDIICEFCECDMSIVGTARSLKLSEATIKSQLESIKKKTGLNPKCFYDLVELRDLLLGE